MTRRGGKFGPIKRQHGRVEGLDAVLERVLSECPHVTRIIPGRMGRKHANTDPALRVKYLTGAPRPTGLKCIYANAGSWQEVFIVCSDAPAARDWIQRHIP